MQILTLIVVLAVVTAGVAAMVSLARSDRDANRESALAEHLMSEYRARRPYLEASLAASRPRLVTLPVGVGASGQRAVRQLREGSRS